MIQNNIIKIISCISIVFIVTFNPLLASNNKDLIIGTHYYGFTEQTWPVNYLNTVKACDIEHDLNKIKRLGFNTIILLASWGEFEPDIGKSNELAYKKINLIIAQAKEENLNVIIRLPYLWSLAANDDILERTANILINEDKYNDFTNFLKRFNLEVVQKHTNIINIFSSWEDLYVLRDLFFEKTKIAFEINTQYFNDTGMKSNSVVKNGVNYNQLLDWIDFKIQIFNKKVSHIFTKYSYEIRVDSDLYTSNNKNMWHSHKKYYMNSYGNVFSYWAPYFGQKNLGELLSSEKAIKSISWSLDLVKEGTNQKPFIDQLNFYDNTEGTEFNAKISEKELPTFFNNLVDIIYKDTLGYSFWTIKDYKHNVIYNSTFSEDMRRWIKYGDVEIKSSSLHLSKNSYISQKLNINQINLFNKKDIELVIEIEGGEL